ncbi:MAG: hypothetical protein QM753_06840 [Thermomicrobiales bacterium]
MAIVILAGVELEPERTSSRLDWPERWGPAPQWATKRNPDRLSYGPAIGRVARELGHPLYPSQQYIVDVAREVQSVEAGDPDPGHLAYDEVAVLAPRRFGKTYLGEALVADCCGRGPHLVKMTAQTREAAAERWAELAGVDPTKPATGLMNSALAPRLKATTGIGNQQLTFLDTGGVFLPFAPNEKAVHGGEPDLVFVDELWWHSLAMKQLLQQAYRPPWLLKDGQEWLFSAAGTVRSGWLHDVRRRGRAAVEAGRRLGLALFEWAVPESTRQLDGPDLVAAVLAHHPRRGRGLRESYLASELDNLGKAGFLRAYGNLDAEDGDEPLPGWFKATTAVERIPAGTRLAVGVAVDQLRRESSVVVAALRRDGTVMCEVVRSAPGIRWVGPYVEAMENVGLVLVGNVKLGRGVADYLEAVAGGAPVERLAVADVVSASGSWLAGLSEEPPAVFHDGDPTLSRALGSGHLPKGRGWESRDGEPVTVLEAASLAVWGAARIPEPVRPRVPFRVM